jgi:hypothetical protein
MSSVFICNKTGCRPFDPKQYLTLEIARNATKISNYLVNCMFSIPISGVFKARFFGAKLKRQPLNYRL